MHFILHYEGGMWLNIKRTAPWLSF